MRILIYVSCNKISWFKFKIGDNVNFYNYYLLSIFWLGYLLEIFINIIFIKLYNYFEKKNGYFLFLFFIRSNRNLSI